MLKASGGTPFNVLYFLQHVVLAFGIIFYVFVACHSGGMWKRNIT